MGGSSSPQQYLGPVICLDQRDGSADSCLAKNSAGWVRDLCFTSMLTLPSLTAPLPMNSMQGKDFDL